MNNIEYYNTLYAVFTDGRKIWDEFTHQIGFVPKGKTQPYFKIKGKLVSRNQLFDSRYCIRIKNRVAANDPILKLMDDMLPEWARD